MSTEEHTDIWTELENAPAEFEPIADLYHWSTNFDPGKGPFALLLDLIGWGDENIGENIYQSEYPLGYVEADKLGRALVTFADHGSSAYGYVERLMELEAEYVERLLES